MYSNLLKYWSQNIESQYSRVPFPLGWSHETVVKSQDYLQSDVNRLFYSPAFGYREDFTDITSNAMLFFKESVKIVI